MATLNNFVIDKVRRVTEVDLDSGLVNFTALSIENPTWEFSGESKEKTDADGVLISKIDKAKRVKFSGETSMLTLSLLASQVGSEVEQATSGKKLLGKTFEVLKLTGESSSGKTATMTHTPKTAPTAVYKMTPDKNIEEMVKVSSSNETDATVAGTTITMPKNYDGTMVGVLYEYETEAGVKVSNYSDRNSKAAQYLVDVLASDVCNPAMKRVATIVFPKAKMDNNFSINMTTEGTHPFSFEALKDYCADDAELCYVLFQGEEKAKE